MDPILIISKELEFNIISVKSVVALLEEGNTIPFIARYRKEATGNLDEVQIRAIQERYQYLNELEERKQVVLKSIESQGKLTDELKKKITDCQTKNALEDLYLPYKPKRRTRATIAKEKGLEPLALMIIDLPLEGNPLVEAAAFVDSEKGVESAEDALSGARDIVAEQVSENAEVRGFVREAYMKQGIVVSKVREEHANTSTKFSDYYDFKENVSKIPSHRYLAIRRGEREGVLTLQLEVPEEENVSAIEQIIKINLASPFAKQYQLAITDAFRRLIQSSVETDVRVDLKMKSDEDAVDIFAENLKNLLLSAPLGAKPVIGIDPGLRTGCKCAVVDYTGKYLGSDVINITRGELELNRSKETLIGLVRKFQPFSIAIGNGTAGRETEAFVKKVLKEEGITDVIVVQVNEAGASVYSASDVAREEFPDLDLTIRGAVSIARRLQDPLAELVKVDPKAIGVGQYQHDVYQPLLQQKLGDVVESCVNHVGVELNTASPQLLSYVSGIGATMAKKIVATRDEMGRFTNRQQLLNVPGLGKKTFQQAAGFLRIRTGENPLDGSAVHPESYALVESMAKDFNTSLSELIGNTQIIDSIDLKKYVTETVGLVTINDIIDELKKPGRDPRSSFAPPKFRDDINTIADLYPGLKLEGVVTNVTAFGAFVDVGVHQDGLIHISELSDTFVKDPHNVVKAGDKIQVTVLEVDAGLKRIALSAKSGRSVIQGTRSEKKNNTKNKPRRVEKPQKGFSQSPFAGL